MISLVRRSGAGNVLLIKYVQEYTGLMNTPRKRPRRTNTTALNDELFNTNLSTGDIEKMEDANRGCGPIANR